MKAAYHVPQSFSQAGGVVYKQALGDVGVSLVHNGKLRVGFERDALEHRDGPDDEGEVGRYLEGVVEGDLGKICCQVLEVDALGTSPLQCLVKHLRP